ncbi:MAG: hypothetical protein VX438_14650 [Planctomycetota bacterium]|nr:hypothetical protein [Planctomycetota bacterium]
MLTIKPKNISVHLGILWWALISCPLPFLGGQDVNRPQRIGSQNPTPATSRIRSWQQHLAMKQNTPFQSLEWQLVGPRMCGGRIESIACPPGNNSTIYAGAGSGGLWKTQNNGITWQSIFDDEPTQAIGDIAISTSNPNIVWVGTGEVLMARSSLAGLGVFKSEDAGKSWKHMGLSDTHHIGRVVIDPNDSNTVYVAAIGHRHSGNAQRGIFKTTNGGLTWEQCLFKGNHVSAIDLVIDPSNSKTIYATTWQRDLDGQDHYGNQSAIYKSMDSGQTWNRLANGLPKADRGSSGRIAIDISKSNPKVIYALFDNAVFENEKPRDILFRSSDAGATWKTINEQDLKTGWDWCEIRVSPENENLIYSIGQKSFLSHDGGTSFKEIGGTIVHLLPHDSRMLHLDTHSMWIDPENPNKVIFGNDGGLYLTFDRCKNWLHLNNLPIAECYAITFDSQTPYNILIGTQDNAALVGPKDEIPRDGFPDRWNHVYLDPWGGGDSYFTYRDPTDAATIYYEHQFGALRRKNMETGKTVNLKPKSPDGHALRFAWMTPFFPSSHDGSTLYYGANRVFKSNHRGNDWKAISPDLTTGPQTPNLRYKAITTLAESRIQKGLLYAGTDNGNLFKTTNDGKSWAAIDELLPRCNFTRVFPSFHDSKTLFVSQSGLATDDFTAYVFRSDDQGKTWKQISKGLPNARVNVVYEDPLCPDQVYVGSDLGVYVSLDGGESWNALGDNLPACSVHDLFVHPRERELVIGTHGRSVFLMKIGNLSEAVNPSSNSQ